MPETARSDRIGGRARCVNRQPCPPLVFADADYRGRVNVESMKQDKRSIVRRRTQQLVYLELGRDNGGVMLNLSEEGCGFQAITPVKCGETRFGFQINGGRRIAGDAEVVWADESGVMGGLLFLNLPAEAHKEIRLWLAETNAPVEHGFAPAAAAASFDLDARRLRANGSETSVAREAGVRVAEAETPPPAPAWASLRAATYPAFEDERYPPAFQRSEVIYGDRRSPTARGGMAGNCGNGDAGSAGRSGDCVPARSGDIAHLVGGDTNGKDQGIDGRSGTRKAARCDSACRYR
jgi:hypothetical protein